MAITQVSGPGLRLASRGTAGAAGTDGLFSNERRVVTTTATVQNTDLGQTIDLTGGIYTLSFGDPDDYALNFGVIVTNRTVVQKTIARDGANTNSHTLEAGGTVFVLRVDDEWVIMSASEVGGGGSGSLAFATYAELNAALDYDANTRAEVFADDGSPDGNGVYRKVGASGAGFWERISDLSLVEMQALVIDAEAAANASADAAADAVAAINLHFETNASGDLIVVDDNGREPLVVLADGGKTLLGALLVKYFESCAGDRFVITDAMGRVALEVRSDGTVVAGSMEVTEDLVIGGVSASGGSYREVTFDAQLLHVLIYGQSNAVGRGGEDLINDTPRYNAVMFNAGERAWNGPGTAAENRASLIPLIAISDGPGGETAGFGFAEGVGERLEAESGGDPESFGIQILVSNGADSGRDAAQLASPSVYFDRLVDDITYGYARAVAAEQLYRCDKFIMIHGESDDQIQTAEATYISLVESIRADVQSTVESVTGITPDSVPVQMLHWQVASHLKWGLAAPHTALIQLKMHDTLTHHHVFMPSYILNIDSTDDVHVDTAYDQHEIGLRAAVYDKRCNQEGLGKYRIKPVSHTRPKADTVIVTYTVPVLPLRFDHDKVAAMAFEGFTLWQADGTTQMTLEEPPIILGSKRILFRASATIPVDAKLRYAFYGDAGNTTESGRTTGPRGNLRDSQGDAVKIASLEAGGVRVDNWAFAEEYVLS